MNSGKDERRKTAKVVAAFLVVCVVVIASLSYWYIAIRPLSMRELLEGAGWEAGTVRNFEDTIMGVTPWNTSLGAEVLVELGTPELDGCAAYGNPGETYRIGDRFRTTLHFQSFTYNGLPAVWVPEVGCPFPLLWESMGVVMDAVALVSGIALQFIATDGEGWTSYQVVTQNADSFPLDRVPVSLRREPLADLLPDFGRINSAPRWIIIAAVEYVALTGGYEPEWEIDGMTSLANRTSPGGRIRFVDNDSDRRIGDWDLLQVRLDANPGEYQTYLLQIGAGTGRGTPSITAGIKFILQTPDGPLHVKVDTPWVQLTHAGDVVNRTVLSRLDIARTSGELLLTGDVEFRLAIGDALPQVGQVRDTPVFLPDGVSVDFWEATPNGVIDTGDRFFVGGLPENVSVRFELQRNAGGWASIAWIAGYGHVAGRIPDVEFWTGFPPGANSTFGAVISHWHPEFEFGKTLAISLAENSMVVLDHVPLSPGLLGTWPGGSLSFADIDSNGVWSTSDEFTLQGNPGSQYRIDVFLLFDARNFHLDLP